VNTKIGNHNLPAKIILKNIYNNDE
jgi:hypothetical protein